ncbi:hypothetical protein ACTFIV_004026 [Dictyostelium citrinum]
MSTIKYSKYVSNQYGFEIEYPEKWIIKEHSAMYLASFVESKDLNSPSLNITIQNLEGSLGPGQTMTPKQLLDILIQQIEQVNATNIETGSCKIGSNNADFLSYFVPEQKVRNKQCFFIKNNSVFIISYVSPNSKFTKNLPVLENGCETFKIFEAKGFKYSHMEAFTSSIKSATSTSTSSTSLSPSPSTYYYQYWVPKTWKSKPKTKEGKHQVQEYTDSSNNLSLRVEVQQKTNKTTDVKETKTSTTITKDKHNFHYDVTIEDIHLSLVFTCLQGDEASYEPLFERFIADLKLDTSFLESPIYDRFYNFIFKFHIHIPHSFKMDPTLSNFTSSIFVDQDYPMYPIFNITLEDLGIPIALDKYKEILMSFYQHTVEDIRINSQENDRADNYRALRIHLDGRDPEIDKNCKIIIKCAVVKRTKGLLLNLRLPTDIYESFYKKYFYLFTSLVFYN